MKSLGQLAHEAWWREYTGDRGSWELYTCKWGGLSPVQQEAWQAAADAVSQAVFERLGQVLDEGDEEPEVKEKSA